MKKLLLSLAVTSSLAATSVFAETGTINFYGKINGNTCSVEIVDPISGVVGQPIFLGEVQAKDFTAVGDEQGGREFSLRVSPGAGCDLTGKDAIVTFTGRQGGAGAGNAFYGTKVGTGNATGIALSIKDHTNKAIAHTVPTDPYALSNTAPTTMAFSAVYRSTAAAVTAGTVLSDIDLLVDIN
jgi:major type 1 subunit fimbrin (pilin)